MTFEGFGYDVDTGLFLMKDGLLCEGCCSVAQRYFLGDGCFRGFRIYIGHSSSPITTVIDGLQYVGFSVQSAPSTFEQEYLGRINIDGTSYDGGYDDWFYEDGRIWVPYSGSYISETYTGSEYFWFSTPRYYNVILPNSPSNVCFEEPLKDVRYQNIPNMSGRWDIQSPVYEPALTCSTASNYSCGCGFFRDIRGVIDYLTYDVQFYYKDAPNCGGTPDGDPIPEQYGMGIEINYHPSSTSPTYDMVVTSGPLSWSKYNHPAGNIYGMPFGSVTLEALSENYSDISAICTPWPNHYPFWNQGQAWLVGDTVRHYNDSHFYTAIQCSDRSAPKEPNVAVDWEDYWEVV